MLCCTLRTYAREYTRVRTRQKNDLLYMKANMFLFYDLEKEILPKDDITRH